MSVMSRTTRELLPDSFASARIRSEVDTGESGLGGPGLEHEVGLAPGSVLAADAALGYGGWG